MLILIWIFQFVCKAILKPCVWVLRLRNAYYVSLNNNLLHAHRMMLLYTYRVPYIKYETITKI